MNMSGNKGRIIRLLIYMIIAFLAAFFYRYFKND